MAKNKLPPPERAAKTAIGAGSSGKGTIGTYLKADALFSKKTGTKLDYGSGRGEGAKLIKADTYEPFVKSKPKYNDVKKIPSKSYNKITSLNVLNVLPPVARQAALKNIGRILKSNGEAIISTRGVKDVESAKNKVKIKDGYIIGKGDDARFQKGFTSTELKNYAQKVLGKNFTVENVKGIGKAGIKIKKLNVPKGLGGITRQDGAPIINIQERLLVNPKKNFSQGGDSKMDEDIAKGQEPKYNFSDENLVNLPPQVLEKFLAKKYGVDRYMRERSSVFEDSSRGEITDRESILTGPELEALSINFENQIKKAKGMKKGGMPQQMELFQEGGLKDEGGTIDPVSGNDVPSGSTQEEVRDDIPAQLSEGEFVFPADVVRYIGLEKLMMIRQRAKAGLKRMEEMGQMGNVDEATLPDDIPFTIDDLEMEDEETPENINKGGIVKMSEGGSTPTQEKEEDTKTVTSMPSQQQMKPLVQPQTELNPRQAPVPTRGKTTTTYSSVPQTADFLKRSETSDFLKRGETPDFLKRGETTEQKSFEDEVPENIGERFEGVGEKIKGEETEKEKEETPNVFSEIKSIQDGTSNDDTDDNLPSGVQSSAVNFEDAFSVEDETFREAYKEMVGEQINILKTASPFANPLTTIVSGIAYGADVPFLNEPDVNRFTAAELGKVKASAFHDVARDIQRTNNYFGVPISQWKPEHIHDLGVRGQLGMEMAEYAFKSTRGFKIDEPDEKKKGFFDKVLGKFGYEKVDPKSKVDLKKNKEWLSLITSTAKADMLKKTMEEYNLSRTDMGLENLSTSDMFQYYGLDNFSQDAQDDIAANGGSKGIGYNDNGTSYSINNNGTFTHEDGTTVNFTDSTGKPGNSPEQTEPEPKPTHSNTQPSNDGNQSNDGDDGGIDSSSDSYSDDGMGGWT